MPPAYSPHVARRPEEAANGSSDGRSLGGQRILTKYTLGKRGRVVAMWGTRHMDTYSVGVFFFHFFCIFHPRTSAPTTKQ
eukprot:3100921-Pyramimonas_sp.AAC.1